jgi:hypothetical protein
MYQYFGFINLLVSGGKMARSVVAVYDSFYSANKAVRELKTCGFPGQLIDISTRSHSSKAGDFVKVLKRRQMRSEYSISDEKVGAMIGIGVGISAGVVLGMLAWTGALHFQALEHTPLASGPWFILATVAAVTIFAAVTGTLLGGTIGLGISDQEAQQYSKTVQDQDVVVSVLVDMDGIQPVYDILGRYTPLEIQEKAPARKKSGLVGKKSKNQAAYADGNDQGK